MLCDTATPGNTDRSWRFWRGSKSADDIGNARPKSKVVCHMQADGFLVSSLLYLPTSVFAASNPFFPVRQRFQSQLSPAGSNVNTSVSRPSSGSVRVISFTSTVMKAHTSHCFSSSRTVDPSYDLVPHLDCAKTTVPIFAPFCCRVMGRSRVMGANSGGQFCVPALNRGPAISTFSLDETNSCAPSDQSMQRTSVLRSPFRAYSSESRHSHAKSPDKCCRDRGQTSPIQDNTDAHGDRISTGFTVDSNHGHMLIGGEEALRAQLAIDRNIRIRRHAKVGIYWPNSAAFSRSFGSQRTKGIVVHGSQR
jgi:hypothetical protein